MTFQLPQLPYAYEALEPHIDAQTMMIHHTKHHQAYIDKLNAALLDTQYADTPIEELLQTLDILPDSIKMIVRNHGGGYYNHKCFWEWMTPGGSQMSDGLKLLIDQNFWSVEQFKEQFNASALANFWSGWTWLVKRYDELKIVNTANQDHPMMKGEHAILGIDIWEHAYYLKYQNRRAEYVQNRWNVVNWAKVSQSVK